MCFAVDKNELGIIKDIPNQLAMSDITEMPSFQRAAQLLTEERNDKNEKSVETGDDMDLAEFLDKIIDQTEFMHDKSLLKILESIQESDSRLVKFNNVLLVSIN